MFIPPFTILFVTLLSAAWAKHCTNFVLPVDISARNGVFGGQKKIEDNFDATKFAQNFTVIGHNYTNDILTGYATVRGRFNISAEFCVPTSSVQRKKTVQFLIHGLSFDKRYWDWPIDPRKYSYVDVATDVFGYSTFSVDRLCAGQSTLADPYSVCQAQAEMAAVDVLTTMLRKGAVQGVDASHSIVHIGHSYGSVIAYLLAAQSPNNTNGIVLTGYSQNATGFAATVAGFSVRTGRSNLPKEFGNLDPGYIIYNDIFNEQYIFMYPPFVTRENEEFVEKIKLPFAFGEIVTTGSTIAPADKYNGPALVLTGRQDAIFCGGDCFVTGDPSVPSIPATVRRNLPHASPFEVIIQPNTGHLINMHFNATGAYNAINRFLESNHL
ncbi:hypothetical protein PUNSTDRAFT_111881 [Punctularia strigosozonata HHB-11173 SS5]|uniref:uncharacterized protein n=1 Tax=Punctularia strigosozonata (strain HHB-11173) TaxID=741275 RepID=UPI000441792B|nr:uncharacterized protein PUNSTDRAFT_111881 [Punctularia strigosozonata HHB-11173 SS5]EIN11858.1 hypothetical protein PUNSTDRAFT_111881 [Punctularia strigosozonata HHB-11173 SS5]